MVSPMSYNDKKMVQTCEELRALLTVVVLESPVLLSDLPELVELLIRLLPQFASAEQLSGGVGRDLERRTVTIE